MSAGKVKIGDRVRIVNAVENSLEDYGYKNGDVHEVMGFTSGDPDIWPDGTEDSAIFLDAEEYEIITGGAVVEPKPHVSTTELLAVKRAESEALAAEIAELEAKVSAGITPGTVVFTLQNGYYDDIVCGALARVSEIDVSDSRPVTCRHLDGSDYDEFHFKDLEPVTYESARARLIAEVDRQLAAAFPDVKGAA
ncbi:hypothetical protein ACX93W_01805 [Paenibacillus sp. CAU 1782]